MFLEFFNFVNESFIKEKKEGRNEYHFVHWYPHEKICYEKIRSSMNLPVIKFMDLSKLFREEPIVVKGSLRFKLKSISKALYNLGLIKSSWDFSSDCNSGLAAMALASKIYEDEVIVTDKNITMKEIIKYNEVDCKVLWEIIDYLRKNH
jgi:predicted RecB family nuclease